MENFHLYLHGAVDSILVDEFSKKSEASIASVFVFFGKKPELPPFQHHLYPTAEIKGLLLKNTDQSQVDFETNSAHTVINEIYADHHAGRENMLILQHFLGRPKLRALECGLATYFTTDWQGNGYRFWAKKLVDADAVLSLSDLLDNERWKPCSNLMTACLSAVFVEFILEKWGKKALMENYSTWTPTVDELQDLEVEWRNFLFAFPSSPSKPQIRKPSNPPFQKGFNFAHEGYQIYNGYGSRAAAEALDTVQELGANSVAIVPYSFLRNPKIPHPIPVVKHAGAETDESVIRSIWDAQQLGMNVLLKPQIWLGGGSWPGDIEMATKADWQQFFQYYEQWIIHYALIAERYALDQFCIGTELVQTTLQREPDWRRLIQKIRKVYSGQLVYAANWGEEFEQLAFWDDLDLIGLDCYYPLSQRSDASDKDLKRGFEQVIERINRVYRRFHKPLIFTEIGFPSVEAAWKKPHEDWGDLIANERHQARCYDVALASLHKQPWCVGFYWWKYPSYLRFRGHRETDFTPYGKAAEAVVEKWFEKY